jgi:hypothetical protein
MATKMPLFHPPPDGASRHCIAHADETPPFPIHPLRFQKLHFVGAYPALSCKTLPPTKLIVGQFDEARRTALGSDLDCQTGEKTDRSSRRKKVETFRNGDGSG